MKPTEAEVKSTLFEKFWNLTKETAKEMKKPLVIRSLKRKFQSAYDSCDSEIIKAEEQFNKIMEDVENLDINKVLEIRTKKIDAEKTKEEIEKIFSEFFGEKLAE